MQENLICYKTNEEEDSCEFARNLLIVFSLNTFIGTVLRTCEQWICKN